MRRPTRIFGREADATSAGKVSAISLAPTPAPTQCRDPNGRISVTGLYSVDDCRVIDLPVIADPRGNLTFIEGDKTIPLPIRRAYWVYDVPGGESRDGHAYRELDEFIVALSGSFAVVLDDGQEERTVLLNRSYFGLYIPPMIWRRFDDFSTNAVGLVLTPLVYHEEDYIRDREAFLAQRLGLGIP